MVDSNVGGAADGRNAFLNYTALVSGDYRIEVLGATKASVGEYTVSVTGATGSAPAFQVTSTIPANGVFLASAPTTYAVAFNDSILLSSLSDSDFTIDGAQATGFTVVDSHDVIFNLPAIQDGVHNVAISGISDIHGTPLTDFTSSFDVDSVPPTVVSSSIANGAVLAPGDITEVVTFDKAIIASTANTSDILLSGQYRARSYTPSTISFDPTGKILTVSYTNIPDDAYTFTLLAGPSNFTSLAGLPLQNSFVVNFTAPLGSVAYPTPVKSVSPAGSLIYQGTASHVIVSKGDTDTFTLPLVANQTLTLIALPANSSLQPTIKLFAPNGNLVGSQTATTAGGTALIQTFPISGGTYKIQVTGAANTTGLYTLTALLNAGVENEDYGGPRDDSLATAQPIDNTAISLGSTTGDRLAVIGTIAGGLTSGDAIISSRGVGLVIVDQATGNVVATINNPIFSQGAINGVKLAPDNTLYVALSLSFNADSVSGELVHLDLAGNVLGTVKLPDDPADSGFYYPYGFDIASDGSFWVAQPNSGNVVHVTPTGGLIASYPVSPDPEMVAVSPLTGHVAVADESEFFSGLFDLDPTTGNVSFFSEPIFLPAGLNFTPSGNLWAADIFGSLTQLDSNYNVLQQIFVNGEPNDTEADANGNIWATLPLSFTTFEGAAFRFDPTGNQQFNTTIQGTPIFQTVIGAEFPNAPALPPPDTTDVYSFHLNANQSAARS